MSQEKGVWGNVYKQNHREQWGRSSQKISALATGSFHNYWSREDGSRACDFWVFTEEARHFGVLALLCCVLFHAKWSGDIRTSTRILIPEHPVVWEPGALLVCQVSSACARTGPRVVQGCSLTSFFTAPLVLPTTFLFIKTTKTKWKRFVVDVKQLHIMRPYDIFFF